MEAIILALLIAAMMTLFLVFRKRENNEAIERERALMVQLEGKEAALEQMKNSLELSLEEKTEAQKKFVKTMSHELRIPISIIRGYSEILTSDMVTDKESQDRYLNKISEKIESLNKLISSIVVEAEQAMGISNDKQMKKCDLVKLVNGVAEDFRVVAEKKNIAIEVLISEKNISIICDEVKIGQVIGNIVNNSIKYMGKPGTIQMSLGYSSSREVTMVIRDNGEGMDKSKENSIFDETTGLGLKICKEGVEQHQGQIWCHCGKGTGLAIYITMPVKGNQA